MKHIRIISLSLALVLVLGLFAACGKSSSTSESGSASQPDASISLPEADLSAPDASTPDASQPEEDTPAPEAKPEEKPQQKPQEKPQTPAPEQKPDEDETVILPVPEAKPEETPEAPSVDHTQRYVAALNDSGCELLQYNQLYTSPEGDGTLALEFVGLTPEVVGQFAISFSMMNTKAFGLAAVMPAEGQKQAVVDGLNSYITRMQQQFERYLPDQYEVAKAAKVDVLSDGTVILVMCEGQDAVLANIKAALG